MQRVPTPFLPDPLALIPTNWRIRVKQNTIQNKLILLARSLGATDATLLSASDIVVKEELARLCREPQCENYGLSPSCPPHVSGPTGFRRLLEQYESALLLKIDVPTEMMLSSQIREIMQLLHEIAAGVEQAARGLGLPDPRAFAGGSCKKLFCRDHATCRVLAESGSCRNPDKARPSMSGFGVDVSHLMKTAGWRMEKVTRDTDPEEVSMGSVAALVLLG